MPDDLPDHHVLDLSGPWRAALDPDGVGEHERWYRPAVLDALATRELTLPGSVQEQGFGDPVTLETPWTGLVVDRSFYEDERYAPYREDGNVSVPFWLQPHTYYRGAVWFQRTVDVPPDWAGRRVVLHLERVHWESVVWLDDRRTGPQRSLSTPHRHDLGELEPGRHVLTLRIDNRTVVDVGPNAHSVSDHTQGNWNGVVGELRLEAVPPVTIRRVTVVPDVARRSARVRIDLAGGPLGVGHGSVTVSARRFNVPGEHVPPPVTASYDSDGAQELTDHPRDLGERGMTGSGGHLDVDLPLGADAQTWDEFHPALYEVTVELLATVRDRRDHDTRRTTFGLREVGVRGTQVTVNDRPTFLRGTLESAVWPLTGYPPTAVEPWRRVLRTVRAHGLNLVRFHSWCPPEAAFTAADLEGVLLQVEGPVWANQGAALGEGRPVDRFLHEETERILEAYGNHPSFVAMAHGNEPAGRDVEFLGAWVAHFRRLDPRRLWTSAAGWPAIPENDFDNVPDPRLHRWEEGLASRLNATPPQTESDHSAFVTAGARPVVSHEVGQWCAYPDFQEASKYTGLMQPRNSGIFADFLRRSGMADQAEEFLHASGRLQLLCYKEEVETALRTPGFAGFHLLGLNDFPGQGTALVGVLDAFWDEKPYATTTEFARFCGPVVPLARLPRRTLRTDEAFSFDVQVAHFGPGVLDAEVSWRVEDTAGSQLAGGVLSRGEVPHGNDARLGTVTLEPGWSERTRQVRLVVRVRASGGTVHENDWSLWVYAPVPDPEPEVTRTADVEEALRLTAAGATVLLTPDPARVRTEVELGFTPVFWNTAWTRNQAPHTLGITHDPGHPLFAGFPSQGHTDWQWWDLLHGAKALVLDGLPTGLRPLVQPIDTWFSARRLGVLLEARVGAGRLVVCTLTLDDSPAATAFRRSLLAYVAGDAFVPATELTPDEVRAVLAPV
ncbi:sugar-binding domain-containing protein [Kineococcus sp. R86509]|uniref:sugar-binding domain-containing protein n=1 Tax=Kineococcus sp. R86509 TaxID=3093851 RepID=UPI0036D2D43D